MDTQETLDLRLSLVCIRYAKVKSESLDIGAALDYMITLGRMDEVPWVILERGACNGSVNTVCVTIEPHYSVLTKQVSASVEPWSACIDDSESVYQNSTDEYERAVLKLERTLKFDIRSQRICRVSIIFHHGTYSQRRWRKNDG